MTNRPNLKQLAFATSAIALISTVQFVDAQTLKPTAKTEARMYTFTGLAGRNKITAYSLGVDSAAYAARKAHPTLAVYPFTWFKEGRAYATVKANYRRDRLPIMLIGHSLGADAVIDIAQRAQSDNIPIAAAFIIDPTRTGTFWSCVPTNVKVWVSWKGTIPFQLGGGTAWPCPLPLPMSSWTTYSVWDYHINIDDRKDVQNSVVKHTGDVIYMLREIKKGQQVSK